MLHPQDPHKNINLEATRRASTELQIDSFGRKAGAPKALLSEGHLYSLGSCVFLAFARQFNTECELLVLDDVVATIDSEHRQKICRLLFEEFETSNS